MSLVALIHATPASAPPARDAFAERFPAARLWNLLDDRLLPDADAAGGLTPPLRGRMRTLIRHAVEGGADAVLLTCSLYGPVAVEEAAAYPVPVLPSDQALFEAVQARDARRVAVLGPIRASVDDTVARLRDRLTGVTVSGTVVDGAPGADRTGLERLVADHARRVAADADVVVLGQFSLAPALAAAQAAVPVPVLSPPHLAADLLRRRIAGEATA